MKSITISVLAFVAVTVNAYPISVVEPRGLNLRESISSFLASIKKPADTKHPEDGQPPRHHHDESLGTKAQNVFQVVGYLFDDLFWGRDLEAIRAYELEATRDEQDARDHHNFDADEFDDGLEDCDEFDDYLGAQDFEQVRLEARDFDDDMEARNFDLEARDHHLLD